MGIQSNAQWPTINSNGLNAGRADWSVSGGDEEDGGEDAGSDVSHVLWSVWTERGGGTGAGCDVMMLFFPATENNVVHL